MSSVTCKLEQDLCRCCHSEGNFKNLAEPYKTACLEEIYVDMLKECYTIDMAPIPGMMSAMTYTICEVCIIRLRDASDFRKQVLLCEERFNDIYKRNGVTAATTIDIDVEIKEEVPDQDSDDAVKEDLALDDKDEDYEVSEDLKANEKEEAEEKPVQVAVRKKRKNKKAAVKTNSVKSKREKEQSLKEEPADENDSEKKPERALPFRLKDGDDYKKDGDKYHCTRCGKIYRQKETMANHVKKLHYKIKKFKCSICIEAFNSEALLIVHKLEVHNVDLRVSCGICNRFFNRKRYLTIHIRDFHMQGEVGRRYKCEFCDFVTLKMSNLSKHKFTHKTVKDLNCKYCKKSFKRRTTLNFHERIHTGDRRKVCSECGQAFVQKASLNYHMTKYHPNVNF